MVLNIRRVHVHAHFKLNGKCILAWIQFRLRWFSRFWSDWRTMFKKRSASNELSWVGVGYWSRFRLFFKSVRFFSFGEWNNRHFQIFFGYCEVIGQFSPSQDSSNFYWVLSAAAEYHVTSLPIHKQRKLNDDYNNISSYSTTILSYNGRYVQLGSCKLCKTHNFKVSTDPKQYIQNGRKFSKQWVSHATTVVLFSLTITKMKTELFLLTKLKLKLDD